MFRSQGKLIQLSMPNPQEDTVTSMLLVAFRTLLCHRPLDNCPPKKTTCLPLMTSMSSWIRRSHTFTITDSNLRRKSADSRWITRKWNTRKSLQSMNWLWPSGSDEQVPPSPPQPVDWDQWRQKSVRWNWCGHQVEDPLTARLASAPFDCWCTPIRCHASARQFYFFSLLKVFSSD